MGVKWCWWLWPVCEALTTGSVQVQNIGHTCSADCHPLNVRHTESIVGKTTHRIAWQDGAIIPNSTYRDHAEVTLLQLLNTRRREIRGGKKPQQLEDCPYQCVWSLHVCIICHYHKVVYVYTSITDNYTPPNSY